MLKSILSQKGNRVEFLTFELEGKNYFAYILMSESDYPKYQEALKSGDINPDQHGLVFAYGEGKIPPQDIKNMVNQLIN